MPTTRTLALVIAALAATGAAAAMAPSPFFASLGAAPSPTGESRKLEKKESYKFVVTTDDDEKGTETIAIDDLAVGKSREIRTESGKKATVSRNEKGFVVTIDGKESRIDLPANLDDDDDLIDFGKSCKIGSGPGHFRKILKLDSCDDFDRPRHHGRGSGHGSCCCCGGSGHSPRAFAFRGEDDDDEDVLIDIAEAGPGGKGPLAWIAEDSKIDLDSLEALKGLDEKTKAKVKEALAEIEKKRAERIVIRKERREGPRRIKVVVIDEDDDEKGDGGAAGKRIERKIERKVEVEKK
jgi:hypothetical protein